MGLSLGQCFFTFKPRLCEQLPGQGGSPRLGSRGFAFVLPTTAQPDLWCKAFGKQRPGRTEE